MTIRRVHVVLVHVCLVLFLFSVKNVKSQSLFTKCAITDASCLRSSAQAFLPTLAGGLVNKGVPSLDPLVIDDITTNQGNLRINFTEPYINGFTNLSIKALKINPNKKEIYIDFTKTGSLISKYDIEGHILVVPISGRGDAEMYFPHIRYQFWFYYNIVTGKDGKKHLKIVKQRLIYKARRAIFRFENLFNGNKQLGDAAVAVANEAWEPLFNDTSPPIMKAVTRAVVNIINKIFGLFSYDDLFLN